MRELSRARYWIHLIQLLTRAPTPQTLCVSIGTADFLVELVKFLVADGKPVMLDRLVVKGFADDVRRQLMECRGLEPAFDDQMDGNLAAIESTLASMPTPVPLMRTAWHGLPPFHGYLLGDHLLIADWQRGKDEQIHHRTALFESTREEFPWQHDHARRVFDSDGPEGDLIGTWLVKESPTTMPTNRHAFVEREAATVAGELHRLTPRERDVLRLLVVGCSNAMIAERLFISSHTVDRHLENIYRKLGLHSRLAVANYATSHDLL